MLCFCCLFFTILHQFLHLYAMHVYYSAKKTHLQLLLLHTAQNNCFGWVHLWVTIKIIFCAAMYQSTAMLPDYSWMCINNSATIATIVAQNSCDKSHNCEFSIVCCILFSLHYTKLSTIAHTPAADRANQMIIFSSEGASIWNHIAKRAMFKLLRRRWYRMHTKERKNWEKQQHRSIHKRIHIHAIVIRRFCCCCCYYSSSVHAVLSYHVNHTRTSEM